MNLCLSMCDLFVKPLTIFGKSSILEAWQRSEYATGINVTTLRQKTYIKPELDQVFISFFGRIL